METNLAGSHREIVLRGGKVITLRPMERNDGENVRRFFAGLSEKERLFVRQDDISTGKAVPSPDGFDSKTAILALAFAENRIAGVATLHRSNHSWMAHLGNMRVTVAPEYRRKGLGRILAGELFRDSLQYELDKIVTEIVKDQVDLNLFYNNLGFRTEASLAGNYLDDNGNKHDVLIMSNSLKQLWKYWVQHNEIKTLLE